MNECKRHMVCSRSHHPLDELNQRRLLRCTTLGYTAEETKAGTQ